MFHHPASRLLTKMYLCKLPCRISGARAQYCPICTGGGYATRGFGGGVGMQKFPGATRRCRAGSDVCRHHARMARPARRRITAGNQQHTTTLKSEQGCQQAGWQAGRQAGACCTQLHAPTTTCKSSMQAAHTSSAELCKLRKTCCTTLDQPCRHHS